MIPVGLALILANLSTETINYGGPCKNVVTFLQTKTYDAISVNVKLFGPSECVYSLLNQDTILMLHCCVFGKKTLEL